MSPGVCWTRSPTLPWKQGASPLKPLDTVGVTLRRLQRGFQSLWMVVGGGEWCADMMWARTSLSRSDSSTVSTFKLAKFTLKACKWWETVTVCLQLLDASRNHSLCVGSDRNTQKCTQTEGVSEEVSVTQGFTPVVIWFVGRFTHSKGPVWMQILNGRMCRASGLGLPVSSPLYVH